VAKRDGFTRRRRAVPTGSGELPINPPNPAIENKTDVQNKTDDRRGIAGYLDNDVVVASCNPHALMA
jgi:hypothetical protein